jgi:hypothetical protein
MHVDVAIALYVAVEYTVSRSFPDKAGAAAVPNIRG